MWELEENSGDDLSNLKIRRQDSKEVDRYIDAVASSSPQKPTDKPATSLGSVPQARSSGDAGSRTDAAGRYSRQPALLNSSFGTDTSGGTHQGRKSVQTSFGTEASNDVVEQRTPAGVGFQYDASADLHRKSAHEGAEDTVGSRRLEWSDEEGQAAYEKFKNRRSLKRKRAAASTRKAKAQASAQAAESSGRKAAGGQQRRARRSKHYGDASDDEDATLDDGVPDYLQRRRTTFEDHHARLKEAGLKLPPGYDDIQFSDDERLEELQERPQFDITKPCAPYKDITLPYSLGLIPAPVAHWLRDYQVQGAAFLHELFVYQKGGILGDDMGLGKTVQVIAFLTAAFGKTGDERDAKRMRKIRRAGDCRWYPRVLVVCPGSLIENWRSELRRWGWWHVDVFHGETKETAIETARTGRLEIMITTYATYRLNTSVVNMVDWDCVVADECHIIKEPKSEITRAMNEVNALCRIGLTGTAIQNRYEELWTLLNWTNPGRFGPLSTWKATISEPLRIGQSHDATVYQLSRARKTAKKLVQNLLPEFFLRRMKTLIADQLPKKSDRVMFCPLTETQRDAYERFLESDMVVYIRSASEPCDCGSGKKRGWCHYKMLPEGRGRWQNYVFPAIATLQKISNHLAMLIPQGTESNEKQAKNLDYLQLILPEQWKELYRQRDSILNYSNPEFCGKWKILRKLLKFWHSSGDKVLVFSHAVRLLRMLQMLFNHTSYNVSYLDGGMSYDERAKTVDDFNSDPAQFVFLISTKAGGVGLNITSANKVVVVDPNWNPSYDLQAQDRAYRIGQVRDVEVFRLVSAGTIEEVVYARQIYKQQQAKIGYEASTERRYFSGIQEKKEQKGEIFGLKNLFSFGGDDVFLKDIINKTNVAESKAAVEIVGFEVDDGATQDDGDRDAASSKKSGEEEAMSQLATLVAEGELDTNLSDPDSSNKSRRKATSKDGHANKATDPIKAILAHAGVEYVHDNSEVIGSSKVEATLSRRAEEKAALFAAGAASRDNDDGEDKTKGATNGQQMDNIDEVDEAVFGSLPDYVLVPVPAPTRSSSDATADSDGDELNPTQADRPAQGTRKVYFKHRPPPDVKKRQFCTMAKAFGYPNATEFALVVEGWAPSKRRQVLEKFYRARRALLLPPEADNAQGQQHA